MKPRCPSKLIGQKCIRVHIFLSGDSAVSRVDGKGKRIRGNKRGPGISGSTEERETGSNNGAWKADRTVVNQND